MKKLLIALALLGCGVAQAQQGPGAAIFVPAVSTPAVGGFINKFRNGTFDVAQRGTSGTVTAGTTAYTVDGWQMTAAGTNLGWAQTFAAYFYGSELRMNAASGLTTATLTQRIESVVASQFSQANVASGSGPITVQFTIKNNTSSSITPYLATQYPTSTDNFTSLTNDLGASSMGTIPAGNTAVVAYTFQPASPAGLLKGYQIQVLFAGQLNLASGFIAISAADIRATPGAALGINTSPPPPELRPVAIELANCQRYYQQYNATGAFYPIAGMNGYVNTTTTAQFAFTYPVPMRTTPALAVNSVTDFNVLNASSIQTTNVALQRANTTSIQVMATVGSASLTPNQAAQLVGNSSSSYLSLSSEL